MQYETPTPKPPPLWFIIPVALAVFCIAGYPWIWLVFTFFYGVPK